VDHERAGLALNDIGPMLRQASLGKEEEM
jgi:hypothetical protein